MKYILTILILFLIFLLIGCGQQSYTSVMPPLEKQEQPIQGGCSVEGSVEGIEEEVNIKYVDIKEEL